MFTALLEQKAEFDTLPSFYQQYQIQGPGRMDAKFFVDKIKQDKRYDALQQDVATDLKIEGLLVARDITCMKTADIFECIDKDIIRKIAGSLVNGSMDYDTFDRVIANRLNSMWHEAHIAEYEVLSSSMALFKRVEHTIPTGLLATDYVKRYVDAYYLIDTYYRKICSNFNKLESPISELEELVSRVESVYQAKFLDPLGKAFSDALKEQGEWRFAGIKMSNGFYQEVQNKNYKKCFVIISDGLRYEI
jgi:hypothetical protein